MDLLATSNTRSIPTGKLPKSINFALTRYNEPETFSAIIFGDPQPYSMDDVDYFTQDSARCREEKIHCLVSASAIL